MHNHSSTSSSEMRRRKVSAVVTIVSLLAIVLAAEVAARAWLPTIPPDAHTWPRAEIGQKLEQIEGYEKRGEEIDVLFVGSSQMAAAANPQLFTERTGLSSYNAAFAGPSMKTVGRWLLDVVEPKLSPDVVVVGIASRDSNDRSRKNNKVHDAFLTSPGYKQETASLASQFEGWLEDVSVFMRYRRLMREPATFLDRTDDDLGEQKVRKEIGERGLRLERPVDYHFREKNQEFLGKSTLGNFKTGGSEYRAVVEMHDVLEERGVEMVLVNMPLTADYVAAHEDPEADMASYHDLLADIVAETDVTFVDGEQAFATPKAFRDLLHLDVEGRDAFTEALAATWGDISDGVQMRVECNSKPAPECRLRPAPMDGNGE
jgi:hypothetical protein